LPPRKALLKLDSDGLPVTDKELKVLQASERENYSWKDERWVTTSNYPEFGRSGSD